MPISQHELLRTIAEAGELNPDLTQPLNAVYAQTANPAELQELAAEGLVTGQAVTYVPCCPKCQGLIMQLNASCPQCHCYALCTTTLAHHMPCAGIFEAPDGLEAITDCPKCRSPIGPDQNGLESVGEMHCCEDCHAHFPEPVMRMYCADCDTNHPMHDLRFHSIYRYQLTPAGEAALHRDGE